MTLDEAGVNSLLYNWICAAIIIIVMILISVLPSLIFWLPRSVLAGIVLYACIGMFPSAKMKEIFLIDTKDSYIVMITFLCTVFWGLFEGLGVGIGLSIVLLVQRSSKPHCALVGRLIDSFMYGSITTFPDAVVVSGVVAFRFDGALFFATTSYLKSAVQVLIERHRRRGILLYFFILDCQAINDIDSSGVLALDTIYKYLNTNSIVLLLTGVKYPVMKLLKRSHLSKLIGEDHVFADVHQAYTYIYARVRLMKGESIADMPNDYIDDKNVNHIKFRSHQTILVFVYTKKHKYVYIFLFTTIIHFHFVSLPKKKKKHNSFIGLEAKTFTTPLNENEKASIAKFCHNHSLEKERKGFQLNANRLRFSFAPKMSSHDPRPRTKSALQNDSSVQTAAFTE
ncbi:sulfate transporter [Reticulomyxa filosa]|uniref:Sulfate transporter n=1 Tax=Reticulomyxa filosa TaxID=46433 RepID=X6MRY4_RETFI|nr:sulfate transporter [Reticulomyxa filosa]|eukprot:ETO16763.1 sulfate transporter [Reticulomyxa filosa]